MSSLASIPAFRALPPGALDAVTRHSRPVRLRADTVMRHAGEAPDAVILLLSGTVVARHVGPSGIEVWPARWEGPAIVDKPSVLDGGGPSTALVARTACAARLLPRARFLDLLDADEAVRTHVLNRLARDALSGRHRLAQAVTLPAVARVAAWLAAHDDAHDDARAVAWRGSQEDLARVLGLSRVTVNRALARIAGAGAIRLTAGGVTVLDHQRLVLLSGGS